MGIYTQLLRWTKLSSTRSALGARATRLQTDRHYPFAEQMGVLVIQDRYYLAHKFMTEYNVARPRDIDAPSTPAPPSTTAFLPFKENMFILISSAR
jgi:hypothetical protein